jgi:hypothetical protein
VTHVTRGLLALVLLGPACGSSSEPEVEPRTAEPQAKKVDEPSEPSTPAPEPEPEALKPLVGEGPSLWRPPAEWPWKPKPLRIKSDKKRARPLVALRPSNPRVDFGTMGWFGDELLILGDDSERVIFRFDAQGELLGTLGFKELADNLVGGTCENHQAWPLIVSEGWFAMGVSCTTPKKSWLVSFDAQGRVLGQTRVEPELGTSLTVVGRTVVFDYRHENNFDTLLVGYSVEGGPPWSREIVDKLRKLTGVGDRLVCQDFDDNWVELDPRDFTELGSHPLPPALQIADFVALSDDELAFIRNELVVIMDPVSGSERRRLSLSFDSIDDPNVTALGPGPNGGFWVGLGRAPDAEVWLVDREGKSVERLARRFDSIEIAEADGRWLWAVNGKEPEVVNATGIPPRFDKDSNERGDVVVFGELTIELATADNPGSPG